MQFLLNAKGFYRWLKFLPLLVIYERTTLLPAPDTYQFLKDLPSQCLSFIFFISFLGENEVYHPSYKLQVVEARADSNTRTTERAG